MGLVIIGLMIIGIALMLISAALGWFDLFGIAVIYEVIVMITLAVLIILTGLGLI